jgi:hypothetical protein
MKTTLTSIALVIAGAASAQALGQAPGEGSTETDVDQFPPSAAVEPSDKARGELYGFAMLDMGYNAGTINEDWYDTMRPTQLPNSKAQEDGIGPGGEKFPTEGNTYASVRQSRLGVKGWFPTSVGELHTIFEFEMFGVGVDAGQTTIRLRHAYGELGAFGAGQYWSPFMDIDVFPNSQEYWGPSGMPFFRNIQVRWMPIRGSSNLTFALEKPGGGRDPATEEIEDLLEERNIRSRYPVPDFSASYKYQADWGYLRASGILRQLEWEDDTAGAVDDLSGDATGWGINLSANLKFGPNDSVLKLLVMHGEGVENYMNDAGGDIGIETDGSSLESKLIPVTGTVLFYDLYWTKRWSSTIGFSTVDKENTNGQAANSFEKSRYALTNLQYHPTPQVMYGAELQYGKRENFNDDYDYDAFKVQFSARYNFSFGLGG